MTDDVSDFASLDELGVAEEDARLEVSSDETTLGASRRLLYAGRKGSE